MKLEGKYSFNATPEILWEVFTDPKYLKKAIPGCEKLDEQAPGNYDVTVKIGISAVKGTYNGKFEVADPEPPNRCRLIGEGSGSPGFVKGGGAIEMYKEGNSTIVAYTGEGQIGGLIAGVGQRLLSGIAKMLLGQFFRNIKKVLKSRS